MLEIWKDVVGFETLYQVSNLGRVKSLAKEVDNNGGKQKRKECIVKSRKNRHGYLQLTLSNNKKYTKTIHRLVAEAFLPNTSNKPQINHINGIKTDNRVENLEWATASENTLHSVNVLGNKSPRGRYNKFSKPVLQIKDDKIIAKFECVMEAERQTGINNGNIANCANGHRKTACGYKWRYENENI